MRAKELPELPCRDRRRFFSAVAATIAAARFGTARAQPGSPPGREIPVVKAERHTSFASLNQIDAGPLNIGYADLGPKDGTAVVLLHGWPYDIHSYVDVAPLLASAGYR